MKIALITDTHLADSAPEFRANCDAARDWIAGQAADLTVHLGDITVDGANHPEHLAYAREAFTDWPTELRFLPGNHDLGDNVDPDSAHPEVAINAQRRGHYAEAFGEDCWSFSAETWTVVGLNAQLFGSGGIAESQQLAWLDLALAGCTGPLGVMLHKPLFRNGPADTEKHHRYLPLPSRMELTDRLAKHDLRFVVNGHTHQRRSITVDEVEHVWAPSIAFIIPDSRQERIGEKIVGAMTLTLDEAGHRFEFAVPPGAVTYDIGDFRYLYGGH